MIRIVSVFLILAISAFPIFADYKFSQQSSFEGTKMTSETTIHSKVIFKAMQNPGFFLEGTIKTYENDKLQGTSNLKTPVLSKATLDQALFEIPKDWTEVDE